MASNVFEISFLSDTYRIKQVVMGILNFIHMYLPTLSEEDAGDLRLIFSELLFNAAIHGNNRDSSKSVRVRLEMNENTIYSVISDEGNGFDYISLMSKFDDESGLIKESGRGIKLVYSLTDSLAFNITGNEIHFYKKVNTHG